MATIGNLTSMLAYHCTMMSIHVNRRGVCPRLSQKLLDVPVILESVQKIFYL